VGGCKCIRLGTGGGLPEGIVVQIRTEQSAGQTEILIAEIMSHIAGVAIAHVARRIRLGQDNPRNERMHWQLTGEDRRGVEIPIGAISGGTRLWQPYRGAIFAPVRGANLIAGGPRLTALIDGQVTSGAFARELWNGG